MVRCVLLIAKTIDEKRDDEDFFLLGETQVYVIADKVMTINCFN